MAIVDKGSSPFFFCSTPRPGRGGATRDRTAAALTSGRTGGRAAVRARPCQGDPAYGWNRGTYIGRGGGDLRHTRGELRGDPGGLVSHLKALSHILQRCNGHMWLCIFHCINNLKLKCLALKR